MTLIFRNEMVLSCPALACLPIFLPLQVAATTSEPDVAVKHYHVGSFQGLLLWAALIVNALLRARPRKAVGPSSTLGTVQGSTGSQLTKRVTTMEEELRQGLILTRGVARQLEKLGIRVRTVRQTLRDPLKAVSNRLHVHMCVWSVSLPLACFLKSFVIDCFGFFFAFVDALCPMHDIDIAHADYACCHGNF